MVLCELKGFTQTCLQVHSAWNCNGCAVLDTVLLTIVKGRYSLKTTEFELQLYPSCLLKLPPQVYLVDMTSDHLHCVVTA